jgi:hypothetical protein
LAAALLERGIIVTSNVNDGNTDGFADIRPEHQWQVGAAFAWLEYDLNRVYAVVQEGETAADDFQLLLIELREQFGHAAGGAPKYREDDRLWVYPITVYPRETWTFGAIKGILDRERGLLTIESDDCHYLSALPDDADSDAVTAAIERVNDDWDALLAHLRTRFEIADYMDEPGWDEGARVWVWELALGRALVEKTAA